MVRTVKNIVLFGERHNVEYFTSKALDYLGYPTQKHVDKLSIFKLLVNRNWEYLRFVFSKKLLFKSLRQIQIHFPYPEPAPEFMRAAGEYVYTKIVEVSIDV